jgi:hypothetical protein
MMTGEGRMRRRAVLAAPAVLAAGPAAAQSPVVDLLLVLAVDASGSIDEDEFALQRDGIAEAIAHPRCWRDPVEAARGDRGGDGGMGLAGRRGDGGGLAARRRCGLGRGGRRGAARCAAVAPVLERDRRCAGACRGLLAAAPWRAAERTIDVSGDGPDMRGHVPAAAARDALVASGVVVNGLAIEVSSNWRDGRLAASYERDVIGGPGAFVLRAEDRRDFARAMRAKLIREIATGPGPAAA